MKRYVLEIVVIGMLMGLGLQNGRAQDVAAVQQEVKALKPGLSRFLLRGYAHSGFERYEKDNSFVGGSFNPIFLWQQSDRLLFEGELEVKLDHGSTTIGLEYANMSYILNKRMIIRVGKFLIPFGIFSDRLHPRWINRLPSNPLGFDHGEQVGPAAALGAEIRGGAPLGASKINYSVYLINGPSLNDGRENPQEGGRLHFDNYEDNNTNKAIGGRFGFLPFSNSSLELGVSAQFAKVGDENTAYRDIGARLFALDLSLVKTIAPLKGIVDVKAQYTMTQVDDAQYVDPENPGQAYTFKNENVAYFVRGTFKPAFVSNTVIQKLEFAGRYSVLTLAEGAAWGGEKRQWAFSLNYWLDWRTVVKFSYQYTNSPGAEEAEAVHEEEGTPLGGAFLVHWSFGF